MAAHSGGRMSAHPSGESGWDDPAQILELLPHGWHGQLLDEYRTALDATRDVGQRRHRAELLNRWQLRAAAYSDLRFDSQRPGGRMDSAVLPPGSRGRSSCSVACGANPPTVELVMRWRGEGRAPRLRRPRPRSQAPTWADRAHRHFACTGNEGPETRWTFRRATPLLWSTRCAAAPPVVLRRRAAALALAGFRNDS